MQYQSVALLVASLVASINAAALAPRAQVACPDGVNHANNAACCKFKTLRDDLRANLFGGVCGEEVHETLRLAFHDAIGFSNSQGPSAGGGADGSIITFANTETNFGPNAGTIDAVDFLSPFLAIHNVSSGDLIQFATAVGITNCPGAPQLTFLGGRPPPKAASIPGLIPEPQDSLDSIFNRFHDISFTEAEAANLIISHTIGRSDHVVPGKVAVPFDTTPFAFDTQFFVELLLKGTGFPGGNTVANTGEALSPLPQGSGQNIGELRLQSDVAFALDPRTACQFQSFINNQKLMTSSFQSAMNKLALVGQNAAELIDCTEAVPAALPGVKKPATFPAGKTIKDIVHACAATPFPTLATDPGAATVIPHCPPSQGGTADDCDNDVGSL